MNPSRNLINQGSSIRITVVLAVLLVLTASLRAQQPIPPPDTIFPLGGLTTGGLFGGLNSNSSIVKQQIPNFGLNMEFNGPLPLGSGQSSVVGPGGVGDALNQFFPGGTNASGSSPGWNPLFTEWDFDLASNESTDNGAAWNPAWDLVYRGWNPNLGIPTSTNAGGEWKIAPGGSPAGTDYLDAGSNNNSLTVPLGSPSDFLGGAGVLYLDFVSRLDDANNNNYASVRNIDPVYAINACPHYNEVKVITQTQGNNTTVTTTTMAVSENTGIYILTTTTVVVVNNGTPSTNTTTASFTPFLQPIIFGDYTAYYTPSQPSYASTHSGNDYTTELANITTFPNANDPLQPQPIPGINNYSVFRLEMDLPSGFDITGSTSTTDNTTAPPTVTTTTITTTVPEIDFSLKGTQFSHGIFVRGVRIRTDWADDLYRNKFLTSSTAPDGHALTLYDNKNPNNVIMITQGLEGQQGVSVGLFQHLRSDMGSNWKNASLLDIGNERVGRASSLDTTGTMREHILFTYYNLYEMVFATSVYTSGRSCTRRFNCTW